MALDHIPKFSPISVEKNFSAYVNFFTAKIYREILLLNLTWILVILFKKRLLSIFKFICSLQFSAIKIKY
jgi:hypothetical protein